MKNIRNFCIIAHIDHGKSTLADRLLEITGTVEKRRMKEQYLDQLELERERGITIKMAPVRMAYRPYRGLMQTGTQTSAENGQQKFASNQHKSAQVENEYILNLIDTPGHPDFGYEVSRALEAVEGAILLVDGTQGIQAQTLSNFYAAKKAGLTIVGAVNKVDMFKTQINADLTLTDADSGLSKAIRETAVLIGCDESEVHKISGKTGQGVKELLDDVIARVPAPQTYAEHTRINAENNNQRQSAFSQHDSAALSRGLIFDSFYDDHKGIVAVIRVFDGNFKMLDEAKLIAVDEKVKIKEVGYFIPEQKKVSEISEGDIGYLVTGLKDPHKIKIGDTLISTKSISPTSADFSRTNAETGGFLYEELTYKLRGIIFNVKKKIGLGHKEIIYQNAMEEELKNSNIIFEREKVLDIKYDNKKIGTYKPDFVIDNKIILELKSLPFIGKNEETQVWTYLKGSDYKLALLINFGSADIFVKRIIYDTARDIPRGSASSQRKLADLALPGYKEPKPVVFVSFYPDNADEYDELKKSLERLKLNDASFTFEPDFNEVLGRGFKGGFLGKLHFEIISQRLEKEFNIKTITSFPSVTYKVRGLTLTKRELAQTKADENGYITIRNPKDLPDDYEEILEPMINVEIICPSRLLGPVLNLKDLFRWEDVDTKMLADKIIIKVKMPLAELISDFDDKLKSVSGGFASFSYENAGFKKSDLVRMDILVANEQVPGLSRVLPKNNIEYEARKMVELLKETLPGQQFSQAVQAKVSNRIIARETIPAMKKQLGNFGKNGGDRTRKMKLWRKQKEGKKKLLSMAKVRISAEDFKKLLSK